MGVITWGIDNAFYTFTASPDRHQHVIITTHAPYHPHPLATLKVPQHTFVWSDVLCFGAIFYVLFIQLLTARFTHTFIVWVFVVFVQNGIWQILSIWNHLATTYIDLLNFAVMSRAPNHHASTLGVNMHGNFYQNPLTTSASVANLSTVRPTVYSQSYPDIIIFEKNFNYV